VIILLKRDIREKNRVAHLSTGSWIRDGQKWKCGRGKRFFVFNVHESMHRNNILIYIYIYIQQGATLHSLFYLETALHVSGGSITIALPAAIAAGSSNGLKNSRCCRYSFHS